MDEPSTRRMLHGSFRRSGSEETGGLHMGAHQSYLEFYASYANLFNQPGKRDSHDNGISFFQALNPHYFKCLTDNVHFSRLRTEQTLSIAQINAILIRKVADEMEYRQKQQAMSSRFEFTSNSYRPSLDDVSDVV